MILTSVNILTYSQISNLTLIVTEFTTVCSQCDVMKSTINVGHKRWKMQLGRFPVWQIHSSWLKVPHYKILINLYPFFFGDKDMIPSETSKSSQTSKRVKTQEIISIDGERSILKGSNRTPPILNWFMIHPSALRGKKYKLWTPLGGAPLWSWETHGWMRYFSRRNIGKLKGVYYCKRFRRVSDPCPSDRMPCYEIADLITSWCSPRPAPLVLEGNEDNGVQRKRRTNASN